MFSVANGVLYIVPLEEQCHNSKNVHFELCTQEVCLRPYLPSGIASHVCFLKWPREGRSVALLMRLRRPGQWFFLSPEKFYFSSCDSVLLGVWYIHRYNQSQQKFVILKLLKQNMVRPQKAIIRNQ
jgi:hypothetical protein